LRFFVQKLDAPCQASTVGQSAQLRMEDALYCFPLAATLSQQKGRDVSGEVAQPGKPSTLMSAYYPIVLQNAVGFSGGLV
jgi:hypothetical protein